MDWKPNKRIVVPIRKEEPPDPNLKGLEGGNCNRTACQKPNAIWYNHSTCKYYCPKCARELNYYNQDAKEMFGHELFTLNR
jgi:hypothetical protein